MIIGWPMLGTLRGLPFGRALGGITFQTLRHTAASLLAELGEPEDPQGGHGPSQQCHDPALYPVIRNYFCPRLQHTHAAGSNRRQPQKVVCNAEESSNGRTRPGPDHTPGWYAMPWCKDLFEA